MIRVALFLVATLGAVSIDAQAATPLSDVVEVSSGNLHVCARTSAGAAWCWGWGTNGQLGDGNAASYPAPVPVSGLSSNVTSISTGAVHSCAVVNGGAKCWGGNAAGQLGDGTTAARVTPVDVVGLTSGIIAVWAGGTHTCALTSGGGVKCWGENTNGQLGDGTTINRLQPVDVVGLGSGVSGGAAGYGNTCAISGGNAFCWGRNDLGQLGDGTQVQRLTPAFIAGLSGVTSISQSGQHTCALTSDGAARCWGSNSQGELGIGTTSNPVATPQVVSGFGSGVAAITTGYYFSCAVLANGTAKCWGGNYPGTGTGFTGSNTPAPANVVGLDIALTSISAGVNNNAATCGIASDKTLRCWGGSNVGQLGTGSIAQSVAPVVVQMSSPPPLDNVVSVSHGGSSVCALDASGGVHCWGLNNAGQLGDGTTTNRPAPVGVDGLASGAVAIDVGGVHACAVTSGGGVKCWGTNNRGQLGDGTTTSSATPVAVAGISDAVSVFVGAAHTCAIVGGGSLKCWGDNTAGQLGNGTLVSSSVPVEVIGLVNPVITAGAGTSHSCAVTSDGAVKCWGRNLYGQLGDGTTTDSSQPVAVATLSSGVSQVQAGGDFTCALLADGSVRCWGYNREGQVGTGTSGGFSGPASELLPTTPVGLGSGVTLLSAGSGTACAVSAGTVKCWGRNDFGALGFPGSTFEGSPTPTEVPYLFTVPVSLAAAAGGCAVTPEGRVRCWGVNTQGQLGRGIPIGGPDGEPARFVTISAVQALTFPPIGDRDINDPPFNVPATSSSGLPVTLKAVDSASPSFDSAVCTVTGTMLTLRQNGACVVIATQAGHLEFMPAESRQTFQVTGTLKVIGRLVNLSSRAQVQTGDDVLIAGFQISPFQLAIPKWVVIRARGPSLVAQGVAGALSNPTLRVVRSDGVILATNDDWQQASNAGEIQSSGFAPSHPSESAVMLLLGTGGYTAVVSGVGGSSGVAIVEVFEVDRPESPLFNISTRAKVLTGDDVLIGGFVIQGDFPRKVIVRARGPSLVNQGVAGALADPLLQVFKGAAQVAANDDWQADPNASQLGIYAPGHSKESALVMTLDPGAYTAIVSGVGSTTGVAIVEVYAVP